MTDRGTSARLCPYSSAAKPHMPLGPAVVARTIFKQVKAGRISSCAVPFVHFDPPRWFAAGQEGVTGLIPK
jgi:hypothetical protein